MNLGGHDPDDEIRGVPPEDDASDAPKSTLPDRLDRLWLHPSELSPLGLAPTPRAKPMWTTTLVAGAAGAILTLAVLGATGALSRSSSHASDHTVVSTSVPIATAQAVAIAVGHSVVAVSARDRNGTRRGSGVCVRKSGEILTSDRLIGDATKIEVTTSDGAVHGARVIGRDSTTDLVLLGIQPGAPTPTPGTTAPAPATRTAIATVRSAVPASFASRAARPGDTMWVVGAPSPGDSSLWMSSGLVASTDSLVSVASGPTTSGLLETAAPSSSASSGGALVDRGGEVIGIVLYPIGDDRMTYAVPISTALSVARDLGARGYTAHGSLGINGIDGPDGPTVKQLTADGPAAAGVHVGDVIEAVDRHEVYTMGDVKARVRHDDPGRAVEITVERDTRTVKVSATLASMVSP